MQEHPAFVYVEDDPFSRDALLVVLKRVMGIHNVHILQSSENFMENVRALPFIPDVFLLDIHMEPHDGFEMLRMLRNELEYKNKPIIALTASVMNEEVATLRASGFDGAIGKPIDIDVLPSLINKIAEGQSVWHIA